ncbi:hypothetical protein RB623_12460 [Mesorhizobium sp. LHD-90]|uniref:hypothetical protein n=1 Tax=Mesorhizobium sp. LHD-90 TaxID=3071414 RepID=UPI0027DF880D|nr:hypothetical protein [Mesorhizobium sp. LHD-90]MDQ6434861.1 hypothetical protein [Mesorhizobium sp. LHD-90]
MWIKLTKADTNNPVLVNLTKISGASANKKGGAAIEFDEKYTVPGSRLAVGESLDEVAELMGAPHPAAANPRAARRV